MYGVIKSKLICFFIFILFSFFVSGYSFACTPSYGDINQDNVVDLVDFEYLRRDFYQTDTTQLKADIDCNGKVDLQDFYLWRQYYLYPVTKTPSPTTQPEKCARYSSVKDCGDISYTYCAVCGDGICQMPQEGCMSSICQRVYTNNPTIPAPSIPTCICTDDCGQLMCQQDCYDNPSPTKIETKPRIVHINSAINGRTIDLVVKQKLEITLRTNWSTGYRWEITQIDKNLLKPIEEPKHEPLSPTNIPGTAITPPRTGQESNQIFEFEVLKAGETKLVLVYRRPWEKNIAPLKEYIVNIIISNY